MDPTPGTEPDDELDPAIRAAFGGETPPPAPGTSSVLEIVSRRQTVPRIALREVEPDRSALVQPRRGDPDEYPSQIDRYHVIGEIGRGGVGVVLRARDLDLGREVALKVLLGKHRADEELTQRFLEEAQIGGQLQHPGIVPVHEIGVYDGDRPYLAMKLVRGETLAELLETRSSPLEERQRLLGVFGQVCRTLAYAHSRGVIHRDLKPSNVMVGSFGEVQVMDWGLAKVLTKGGASADARPSSLRVLRAGEPLVSTHRSAARASDSVVGSVMGTPAYMPPEQANGDVDSLDERSDVFGLGAILCEILTGRPPYQGGTVEEVCARAKRADLANAHERIAACGADEELKDVARWCLRREMRDRPRNAIVVARRIDAHLESLEARARALEVRAARTRSRLVIAAVAVAALVLGGTAYLVFERERREQRAISLAATEKAAATSESLRAQALATRDLATWEAALRESLRALDLAGDDIRPEHRARLEATRDEIAAEVKDQRNLDQLERLLQDRGAPSEELFESYRSVLASYGIDVEETTVEAAAEAIRASSIRASLVLMLDQWLLRERSRLRERIFEIAQAVDTDAWRSQLRAAVNRGDQEALVRAAEEAEVRDLDPSTFELLGSAFLFRGPRFRFGGPERLERAEAVWRRAQQVHPDDFWINVSLGGILREGRKPDEAVSTLRIAVALRPESAFARLELGSALEAADRPVAALRELQTAIELNPASPGGMPYRFVSRILDASKEEIPPERIEALLVAVRGVLEGERRVDREAIALLLAQGQHALGRRREAVLTLEDAERSLGSESLRGRRWPPRRRGGMSRADRLRAYRQELRPDLVSYASIDALLEGIDSGAEDAVEIQRFRTLHSDEASRSTETEARLLYLEGREHERAGRLEEAISRLRGVVGRDDTLPEPYLHLASDLRSLGRAAAAEQALRDGLGGAPGGSFALWTLWLQISLSDLRRGAAELRSELAALPDSPSTGVASYREDLGWLLDRLSRQEPIRINCGGERYEARDGSVWGRDRFYPRGLPSHATEHHFGEVEGTDDDPLFHSERWFSDVGQPTGYRIPLPRGRYRVDLLFAEVYYWPLGGPRSRVRRFDILVEGRTVRSDYAPIERGFAVADTVLVETDVEDGLLDIEFVHRRDNPKISAILVRRLE